MTNISFIIKHRQDNTLRIARTATTMPLSTDELQRIIHALARTHAAAFAHHEGFTYVFGDFAVGMEPPAEAHALAFPYTMGD